MIGGVITRVEFGTMYNDNDAVIIHTDIAMYLIESGSCCSLGCLDFDSLTDAIEEGCYPDGWEATGEYKLP